MERKTIIHEFDPCIYPRLLWVVKGGTIEGIQETLELVGEGSGDMEGYGAVALPVRRKEDSRLGYCVWFPRSSDMNKGEWVAHESTHVALCIFDDVGAKVSYEDQEPFAYLVGWVFECIDTVRKHKEVKHGSVENKSEDHQARESQTPCEAKEESRNG